MALKPLSVSLHGFRLALHVDWPVPTLPRTGALSHHRLLHSGFARQGLWYFYYIQLSRNSTYIYFGHLLARPAAQSRRSNSSLGFSTMLSPLSDLLFISLYFFFKVRECYRVKYNHTFLQGNFILIETATGSRAHFVTERRPH